MHAEVDARPPARLGAVVLLLALMPFPVLLWTSSGLTRGLDYETVIFPADAVLAMILVVAGGAVARSVVRRDGPAGTRVLALLAAVMAGAWLVHPSGRGLLFVVTLAGAVALAGATAELVRGPWTRVVAGVIGGVAIVEMLWSAAQALLGHSLGLTSLGENSDGVLEVGRGLAPYGSFVHPYVLAGFALVAAGTLVLVGLEDDHRSRRWFVAAGLAVMPVGWTYSRAALIGLAMLVAAIAVGALRPGTARPRFRAALLALVLGAGVAGAAAAPGWLSRASTDVHAGSTSVVTTDRTWLMHEAGVVIGAHPVTGVGPALYMQALRDHYGVEQNAKVGIFKPVHNVVLLATAEGGIAAGAVVVLLLLVLAWRSYRAGPAALGLYLAFVPYLMLDHFPWTFSQGLVILGLWIGVLDAAARRPRMAAEPHEEKALAVA